MSQGVYSFEGIVKIYLQGIGALYHKNGTDEGKIEYTIGTPESQITINDFRADSNREAIKVLSGIDSPFFTQKFNSEAFVTIHSDEIQANIEIHDSPEPLENPPTLWMGVRDRDQFPAYPFSWYLLKDQSDDQLAFAILYR